MDRIIVKKTEDILKIVEWSKGFLNTLPPDDPVSFKPPFAKGEIYFEEEGTRIHFESLGEGDVAMSVYTRNRQGYFVKYKFNYSSGSISDVRYGDGLDAALAAQSYIEKHGDVNMTYSIYWFCLMLLATYYRPELERKQWTSSEKKLPKKAGKKNGKRQKTATKTLYVKNYVVDTDTVLAIPRHHRKPDHEFGVRGHYRHYKSGKVVWIEPHKRCVGKGREKNRDFIAKMESNQADS